MNNTTKLIISIIVPVAIGASSSFFTAAGVNDWYLTIQKPSFNPPNWIFAPVWTALYILMGVGLYFIWQKPEGTPYRSAAITIFIIQLTLNFFWSFLFFKAQQPGYALAEIAVLWISILLMIIYFAKVKPIAGYLQIPYLCWVSFATILNYSIWQLNR